MNGAEPEPAFRDVRIIGNSCIIKNVRVTLRNVSYTIISNWLKLKRFLAFNSDFSIVIMRIHS